jgi:hypothetical protein
VLLVLPRPSPRICYYFTDEYLYAGSNDIEFVGQALW